MGSHVAMADLNLIRNKEWPWTSASKLWNCRYAPSRPVYSLLELGASHTLGKYRTNELNYQPLTLGPQPYSFIPSRAYVEQSLEVRSALVFHDLWLYWLEWGARRRWAAKIKIKSSKSHSAGDKALHCNFFFLSNQQNRDRELGQTEKNKTDLERRF